MAFCSTYVSFSISEIPKRKNTIPLLAKPQQCSWFFEKEAGKNHNNFVFKINTFFNLFLIYFTIKRKKSIKAEGNG